MEKVHRYERFEVRPSQRLLVVDGEPAPVGARAFDVLLFLIEHAERVVTKAELLDSVWAGIVVEENNLAVQVGTLRRLLGADTIATIAGRGYRFTLSAAEPSEPRQPGDNRSAPAAPDAPPGNVPRQMTSLIGRETAVAEVATLLESSRLVTLLGTGGLGKTRLMIAAAGAIVDRFPDGIWFVDLTSIADPLSVPAAIARALNVMEEPGRPVLQTLCEQACSRRLLVLLDNCEHLLDACAGFSVAFLLSGSAPRILATSREPLNVDCEQAFLLPALALPDPDASVDDIGRAPAVQLFVERARLHAPQFAPRAPQLRAVAELCARLEGIPLALELAAARIRVLSVEQMLDKLDDHFGLLAGGSRNAPARHQTLRATIDWSYALLSESEKALLCRLAVFAGGWTLDAAQQVCASDGVDARAVFDGLTQLVNKSLVVSEERGGTVRHRLLESVRIYARERLQQSMEESNGLQRHLAYFTRLAEESEAKISTAEQLTWLDRLETENDNLRAAMRWAAISPDQLELGLRLAAALRRFWSARGFVTEGRGLLAGLLAVQPAAFASSARGKALSVAGVLAYEQSEYALARSFYEQSLAIRRELGERQGIANSLNNLANVHLAQDDFTASRTLHEESLAIRRELGDRAGIAVSLSNLGLVSLDLDELDAAEQRFREALAINRELRDHLAVASLLNLLGTVAEDRGDFTAAYALAEEALAIRRAVGDRPGICGSLQNLGCAAWRLGDVPAAEEFLKQSLAIAMEVASSVAAAEALESLADVALSQGDAERAARLWGAAERLRQSIGVPMQQSKRADLDCRVGAAKAALGNERFFSLAWQTGRAMSLESAVAFALGHPNDPPPVT